MYQGLVLQTGYAYLKSVKFLDRFFRDICDTRYYAVNALCYSIMSTY